MRIATTTQDLADLSWSPNSKCFVVWDILLTYKLLVYDSAGRCLASYSAYKDALGIRTIQWSPDGSLLAVGSYDQVQHPPSFSCTSRCDCGRYALAILCLSPPTRDVSVKISTQAFCQSGAADNFWGMCRKCVYCPAAIGGQWQGWSTRVISQTTEA